ncbi:hypothetical protein FJZ28_02965 [Candidatus Peregrinibacteria bacterium]|nr:hypothetical protein [Candidatus Peregrinibacteria bacterium]
MRPKLIAIASLLLLAGCARAYEQNPDPNHTHADFAVWVDGVQADFSGAEYMSGLSTDETTHDEADEVHDQYLHLHDSNGHVIHSHKPGLTVKSFFDSIKVGFTEYCYSSGMPMADGEVCGETPFRFFVNGKEQSFDLDYVFQDMDQLLITNAQTDEQIAKELDQLTDDACLYSRTCPWRGEPPSENCIADPAVPCVAPDED